MLLGETKELDLVHSNNLFKPLIKVLLEVECEDSTCLLAITHRLEKR
jgi:hypothetical protein